MNLGKAFKTIREELGLTRPQVAGAIGLTSSALWKIEAGKTNPKEGTVAKFCYRYKVPLARLYTLAFEKKDFSLLGATELVPDKFIFDSLRQ